MEPCESTLRIQCDGSNDRELNTSNLRKWHPGVRFVASPAIRSIRNVRQMRIYDSTDPNKGMDVKPMPLFI
jgi:hypothetical protein